jgi:hypothetical protein
LYTRDVRLSVEANAPLSMSTVPVTAPFTWLVTQVEMPPALSGSGAPKKNWQVPLPHCAFSVHLIEVSLVQRRALMSPSSAARFWMGPPTVQTPQGRASVGHSSVNVSLPSETTVALCARPVQPLSSTF